MAIIDMDKIGEALNTKADIDLNNTGVFSTSEGGGVNLTSSTPANASGKEVTSADFFQSNLLNYTTNRILEIPQDIKLELNNGTLTLKAGSKVYVPNGFEADGTTPKFDVVTIENDIVSNNFNRSGTNFIRYESGVLFCDWPVSDFSSSSNTSSVTGWYYDTSKNEIKYYNSGVAKNHTVGLPLGVSTASNGIITSIDQVFNGFGYIGSTVFALPGVKVQIPNGRNTDGTCKSLITNITSVKTLTVNASWGTYDIFITHGGGIGRWPDIVSGSAGTRYNATTNYYEVISDGKWISQLDCVFVKIKTDTTSPYKITSFEPYTVDSVLNSNLSNLSAAGEAKLKSNIQLVNELPANPEPGVLYCIPEA